VIGDRHGPHHPHPGQAPTSRNHRLQSCSLGCEEGGRYTALSCLWEENFDAVGRANFRAVKH
jgi:hypothetical protein